MQRALTQQWLTLAEDFERALALPDLFKRQLHPRLVILEFLLTLARADEVTMRSNLLDRCSPCKRPVASTSSQA